MPCELYKCSDDDVKDFRDIPGRISTIINDGLNRTSQMFRYSGGCSTLDMMYIESMIQTRGYGAFAPYDGRLIFLVGNLGGKPDELYRPTEFVYANPALNISGSLTIGKDCVVIKNDPMMEGMLPMMKYHASLMATTELSLYIADINSRITNAISAGNDGDKAAAELFLADIEKGKLGVILGQNILNGLKSLPYGGTSNIITDLIELEQYAKGSMMNQVGLDHNFNMKRETITSSEIQMNKDALNTLPDAMLAERRKALKQINELFPEVLDDGEFNVEFGGQWERKEGDFDVNADITRSDMDD